MFISQKRQMVVIMVDKPNKSDLRRGDIVYLVDSYFDGMNNYWKVASELYNEANWSVEEKYLMIIQNRTN